MRYMDEGGSVTFDSLGGDPLVYSNEQRDCFRYTPAEFEVRVAGADLRRVYGLARRIRLVAPAGWTVADPERLVLDSNRSLVWRVQPAGEPPSCLVNLTLQINRS